MPFLHHTLSATWTLKDNAAAVLAIVFTVLLTPVLYNLFLHPLRHVPGPYLGRATSLFLYAICYLGIEGRVLRHYHEKHGAKVLRIAPNHVSIYDSAAIHDIYIKGGGFEKDARYRNFNLGPVVSIFSAIDTEYRSRRAKAVALLFAPARLRKASEPQGVIATSIAEWIAQFQATKTAALKSPNDIVKADILDLSARLSIDVVTGYLLGERYGGLQESADLSFEARQKTKLSANPFIFAIVAFARFSLLPHWLFRYAYAVSSWIDRSDELDCAFARLDRFANHVVETALDESTARQKGVFSRNETSSKSLLVGSMDTYQGRLLESGITPTEAAVQSKAIIFAGADSTAVMLVTILFHLVQNVDVRGRLLHEIRSQIKGAAIDPQTLPYLRGVVKEGLRLGMANPMRFTRIVPAEGLYAGGFYLPPGAIAGCAPYMLHHDPEVFPDPFSFRPERWSEDGTDNGLSRPHMERGLLPFGVGLRACLGKNLAQQQIYESVMAVVDSGVLEGARTCQDRIEIVEWFNGEVKGHKLEIEWPVHGCDK